MSPSLEKACIYVVDDEPIVLSAISQTLESLGCQVKSFANPQDCLREIEQSAPDLLVSDVNMPDMDGVQLLAEVKKVQPLLPVIMITGYGDIPSAVKAVKLGAVDFVEKPLDEDTFLPLVQSVLEQTPAGPDKPLTKTELQVMQLISEGKSNKVIAYELDRSIRTVENHRHRLMKKLGVSNAGELVKVAMQLGLVKNQS